MKFLLLLVFFTTFNNVYLTLTEEKELDNIAWIYAQFSLTFDPAAISSIPVNDASESLLPLYQYFKNNKEVIDKYKHVLEFFEVRHLQKIFPLSFNELNSRFEERLKFFQNEIIAQDQIPLTFNAFFEIFRMLHRKVNEDTEYEDIEDKEVGKEKFTSIANIPRDHPLMQQFCHFRPSNHDEVIASLNNFKLREFIPNTGGKKGNKLNKRDFSYLKLSKKFVEQLEGIKDPKPTEWSIHHMIPSKTIEEFYKYYFELLSQKSDEMLQHKTFDWIKIQEIQTQNIFLIGAEKIWKTYGEEENDEPIYNYVRNPNSAQEDFVRFWFRWPIGLLFYGPSGDIRKNDPKDNFEEKSIHIVGKEYFDKAEKLNIEILEFIQRCKSKTKSTEELNKMAMFLYNRLRTISREAPWKNKIIAPYEVNQWKNEPNSGNSRKIWEISSTGEWGIKTLTQQFHQISLLPAALPVAIQITRHSSHHSEFKRRKRLYSTNDPLFYVQMLQMKCGVEHKLLETTTKEPENGFWCSPFYLRLNPMEYIYCKLSGHHNLHFF